MSSRFCRTWIKSWSQSSGSLSSEPVLPKPTNAVDVGGIAKRAHCPQVRGCEPRFIARRIYPSTGFPIMTCHLWDSARTMNKFHLTKQNTSFARPYGHNKKEAMENFAQLMQRLLEIQSGGRQRNPKLITEDQRLTDRLEKRTLAAKPPPTVNVSRQSV